MSLLNALALERHDPSSVKVGSGIWSSKDLSFPVLRCDKKEAVLKAMIDLGPEASSSHHESWKRIVQIPDVLYAWDWRNDTRVTGQKAWWQVIAAMLHLKATENPSPCNECRRGQGYFDTCRSLPGELGNSCTNCYSGTHQKDCSLGDNRGKPGLKRKSSTHQTASSLEHIPSRPGAKRNRGRPRKAKAKDEDMDEAAE
jgi:hypothetical protein